MSYVEGRVDICRLAGVVQCSADSMNSFNVENLQYVVSFLRILVTSCVLSIFTLPFGIKWLAELQSLS